MSVELYSTGALPWRRVVDKHKVLVEKDKFFLAPGNLTSFILPRHALIFVGRGKNKV